MAVTVVVQAKYHKTCGKCKSELEYIYSDVQEYKINHDYLGDYDVVAGIRCPTCSNVVPHTRHKHPHEL